MARPPEFEPGSRDPHVWLGGWYPETEKAENASSCATPKFSRVLKAALSDRVTVVVIPNAGHALVPGQPEAMAHAIAAFVQTLQLSFRL